MGVITLEPAIFRSATRSSALENRSRCIRDLSVRRRIQKCCIVILITSRRSKTSRNGSYSPGTDDFRIHHAFFCSEKSIPTDSRSLLYATNPGVLYRYPNHSWVTKVECKWKLRSWRRCFLDTPRL